MLCPHAKGIVVIPTPAGQLWHAADPNEGIHFDYLYLGEARFGSKYVPVIKDDLYDNVELVKCAYKPSMCGCIASMGDAIWNATSEDIRWYKPFQNKAMDEIAIQVKVKHDGHRATVVASKLCNN
jgi:hypothetical protein